MADSKTKVVVAFSRDAKEIGKTREVDPATAQAWVAEGRAAYADKNQAPKGSGKTAGHGKVNPTPIDATDRGDSTAARK